MEHVEYRIDELEASLTKARKHLDLINRIFGYTICAGVVFIGVIFPLIVR